MDTSILNILIEAVHDRLVDQLDTQITDETKVELIRPGLLQADPTDNNGLNILIHPGGDEFPDELATENPGIETPAYEVGGRTWWWRRFRVQFELFFDREKVRENARTKANVVHSRARRALQVMTIPTTADSFGEQALLIQIRGSSFHEGGGEGTFIWYGVMWIEFLTSIPGATP